MICSVPLCLSPVPLLFARLAAPTPTTTNTTSNRLLCVASAQRELGLASTDVRENAACACCMAQALPPRSHRAAALVRGHRTPACLFHPLLAAQATCAPSASACCARTPCARPAIWRSMATRCRPSMVGGRQLLLPALAPLSAYLAGCEMWRLRTCLVAGCVLSPAPQPSRWHPGAGCWRANRPSSTPPLPQRPQTSRASARPRRTFWVRAARYSRGSARAGVACSCPPRRPPPPISSCALRAHAFTTQPLASSRAHALTFAPLAPTPTPTPPPSRARRPHHGSRPPALRVVHNAHSTLNLHLHAPTPTPPSSRVRRPDHGPGRDRGLPPRAGQRQRSSYTPDTATWTLW